MSYITKVERNGLHKIVEKETSVEIELKKDENAVRDICRKLNLGSGFAGFTPPFFAGYNLRRS